MKAQSKNIIHPIFFRIPLWRYTINLSFLLCAFISSSAQTNKYFQRADYDTTFFEEYLQQWVTSSTSGASIIKTLDSNLFITGTGPLQYNQVTFIKATPLGGYIWSLNNYDPLAGYSPNTMHSYETGQAAQTEADSGYVIKVGFAINGYSWDNAPYMVKLDKNGNYLWAKYYSHDTSWAQNITYARTIISNYSGGFLIAGQYWVTPSSIPYIFLVNCDADGNIIWKRYYNGTWLNPNKIIKTPDHGYAICGAHRYGGYIPGLLKLDSSGNAQFYQHYNTDSCLQNAFSITAGKKHFFITGTSITHNTIGSYSPFILSVDSAGNPDWFKVYGTTDSSVANDIAVLDSGDILVAGAITINGSPLSYFKTDSLGKLLWARSKNSTLANPVYGASGLLNFDRDMMMLTGGQWTFSHLSPSGEEGICAYTNLKWTHVDSFPAFAGTGSHPSFTDAVINILPPPITFQFSHYLPHKVICPTYINNAVNENPALEDEVVVFPIPTNGIFTITTKQSAIKNIEVINVLGEKVYQLDAHTLLIHTGTIDLSSEPEGIYFVRVGTGGDMVNKKIILAK